jgi:hypothetical protein
VGIIAGNAAKDDGLGKKRRPKVLVGLRRSKRLVTAKSIILGLLVVLGTGVAGTIVEVFALWLDWFRSPQGTRGIFGVDPVTLFRNRFMTPAALTGAVVIFVLTVVLASCRSTQ